MHTKKFTKRLTELADSEVSVEKIVDILAEGLVTNRVTLKDLKSIAKEMQASASQKAHVQAPNPNVITNLDDAEFEQTDTLGLQVQDGDLMYKRTFDGDVNKLLQ